MPAKFNNKYRNVSIRLHNWDYGRNAFYYITICTKNREHFFGEIVNREMVLNELGKMAETEWLKTKELRMDMNLELCEYVVMPNHFHAILFIGENEFNTGRAAMHRSPTGEMEPNTNKFGPQSKNLASIIRGYKSAVTTFARKNNIDFAWQPRFNDHIIFDAIEFKRIQKYIANNPKNWKDDSLNE